jgi:hypothetical protein
MLGIGTGPEVAVDRACMQDILQHGTSTRRSKHDEDAQLRKRATQECRLFTNPWRFSFLSGKLYESVKDIKDSPVLIYYINYYFMPSHLLMRTKNEVLNVFPVQPDLQIEPQFRIPSWSAVHPEAGMITGRVVQASLEYPVRKTYEVVIQESQNANNFRAMSVNDREMFQYITRAMLTGRLLRIEFTRLWGPHAGALTKLFNYMSSYRVISVEILPNQN